MRFLTDGQLPRALASRLRKHGLDAIHVFDLGLGDAEDWAIWKKACRDQRIIISKDEGFAAMAMREDAGTSVLWIRLGNTTNRVLWATLKPVFPEIVTAFEQGERLVEVR